MGISAICRIYVLDQSRNKHRGHSWMNCIALNWIALHCKLIGAQATFQKIASGSPPPAAHYQRKVNQMWLLYQCVQSCIGKQLINSRTICWKVITAVLSHVFLLKVAIQIYVRKKGMKVPISGTVPPIKFNSSKRAWILWTPLQTLFQERLKLFFWSPATIFNQLREKPSGWDE